MRVDGREIPVTGSLLQPLTRRTTDIVRVMLAALWLAVVIAASVITRPEWLALERSVSDIVGFLTPDQSNLVYLLYGVAILILPFAILIELVIGRQWKLLAGYAAAGLVAGLLLSITGTGLSAPQWHLQVPDRLDTFLSQFLDDPRWIAMLAAVLTVSGPWLPARWRRWWWALLLAFVPIHLVVSAVVPARSLLGLSVGWFVGALVVLVDGELVCFVERGGKTLLTFTDSIPSLESAAGALVALVRAGRISRLTIDAIDSEPVRGTDFGKVLVEAGFATTPRGIRLRYGTHA